MNFTRLQPITRAFWPGLMALGLLAAGALAQGIETVVSAGLFEPYGVAVDTNNNYYITDSANNRIALFYPDKGVLTNFAGLSGPAHDLVNGRGSLARFYSPQGIVTVPTRNGFVVSDSGNNALRLVGFDGTVTSLAGASGDSANGPGLADGPGTVAQFNAPAGLDADVVGNVYVADLGNGAIRMLDRSNVVHTLLATNLSRPSAVTVAADGRVYVADTGNHAIKVINTNGTVEVLAGSGSRLFFGLKDAAVATNALFDSPSGLLWVGSTTGLLVNDTGNHVVRRVFTNSVLGGWSVETVASTANAGLVSPVGLTSDVNGDYLIADLGANALRRIVETAPPKPVANPVIGTVTLTIDPLSGARSAVLTPVTDGVFNNDVVVAVDSEDGTSTFVTLDGTDPSGSNGLTPPAFEVGQPDLPETVIRPPRPDVTIKAISTATRRRASGIVTARFRFQVANPAILGNNPGSVPIQCVTSNAVIRYTTNGSEPTTNSPIYEAGRRLNILNGTNNVTLKVVALRDGYQPSRVVTQLFLYENLKRSHVGFSGDFHGAPGATVLLRLDVDLAAGDVLRSLQFRLEVRPKGNAPAASEFLRVFPFGRGDFVPFGSESGGPTSIAYYQNGPTNGLGIAYIGRESLPVFQESGPLTLIAVRLPRSAQVGQAYSLAVFQASGTLDGVQDPVDVEPLADRTLTVSNSSYLVGDTATAAWYNAGDFGDGSLNNNDVNNAFYASLGVRVPFSFTDVFDALDAFPVDTDTTVGGDGQIRYLDWQVILQRSLGLRKDNWVRNRGPDGLRHATSRVAQSSALLPGASKASASNIPRPLWEAQVRLWAGTLENAKAGTPVRVPIYVQLASGANLAGLQFWPVISLQRDATESVVQPGFEPNVDLGIPNPSLNSVPGYSTNTVIFVWDSGRLNPALVGSNLLGWVTFQVPPSALNGEDYILRFQNADGAPKEDLLYNFETIPGGVWVHSNALRPAERISDEWKVRFFGSFTNAVSQDSADPDGDGLSNLSEFLLNTNPLEPDWRAGVSVPGGRAVIRWYSESGKNYGVLSSSDLLTWQQVSAALPGGDRFQEFTDPNPATTTRFYRVRILP